MKPTLQSRLNIKIVVVALEPSRIWWSTEFSTLSTRPAGMQSGADEQPQPRRSVAAGDREPDREGGEDEQVADGQQLLGERDAGASSTVPSTAMICSARPQDSALDGE